MPQRAPWRLESLLDSSASLCLALALAGTAVITQGAGSQSELLGIAAVLISVVFWGFASVFMRRLTAKYPAVLVTTYSMAISLIFHIAQYTWTRCLSILPASTCSLFYPLQPVFAALLGAVILKETFTSTFAIGLALISLDVVLSTWETKKLAEAKEQK